MNTNSNRKSKSRLSTLADHYLHIEAIGAKEAKEIKYLARSMIMTTMPHSKPKECYFQRTNGLYTMTMLGDPRYGLPYGSLVRILLIWLTSEAKTKKSPILHLGKSFSSFLTMLDFSLSGGSRSDRTRLKNQMLRLFTTKISYTYQDNKVRSAANHYLITRSYDLWWQQLNKEINDNSKIILSQDFFDEIVDRPVPIDMRMIKALRKSPLQIDIYQWLTYRFSYLKKPSLIRWNLLSNQLGSNYSGTSQGLRDFKKEFLKALDLVLKMYQGANVDIEKEGIRLNPSKTHVKSHKKEVVC